MKNKLFYVALAIPIVLFIINYMTSNNGSKTYTEQIVTITDIKKIGKLFTSKAFISLVVEGSKVNNTGVYIIVGEGKYYVDINDIEFLYNYNSDKIVDVVMKKPNVETIINVKKTHLYNFDKSSQSNNRVRLEIDKEFMPKAELILHEEALRPEKLRLARTFAEEFVRDYLKNFDKEVKRVIWSDIIPKTLSTEILEKSKEEIKNRLFTCIENKDQIVIFDYVINKDGSTKDIDVSEDNYNIECLKNVIKNYRYMEFYGEPIKIRERYHLKKDVICDLYAKKIYKNGKGVLTAKTIIKAFEKKLSTSQKEKFSKNGISIKKILETTLTTAQNYKRLGCKISYLNREDYIKRSSYYKKKHIKTINNKKNCINKNIYRNCLKATKNSVCYPITRLNSKGSFQFGGFSEGKFFRDGTLEVKVKWLEICNKNP